MSGVRLKFNGGELLPKGGVTTLGRTSDNDIAFPNDSNVSRYHAEIEVRGSEYCLIDLNSSNGTTVNGVKVAGEAYLKPGDKILLGGSSEVTFEEPEEKREDAAATSTAEAENPVDLPPVAAAVSQGASLASASSPAAGSRTMLMIAGGAVLIAVVVVGVTGAIYYRSSTSACAAKAKIVKPESGETIYSPTEIEVDAENSECVVEAVFTLDGEVIGSSDKTPFTATIDPKEYPALSDGNLHNLAVVLIDANGKQIPQEGGVELVLETRKVEKPPEKDPGPEGQPPPIRPTGGEGKEVSPIDIQRMTVQFAGQFKGTRTVPNKQFLLDVQKAAREYSQEGYYAKAAVYQDPILKFKYKNIPSSLGFVLAMSRSRFDPRKQGNDEGIWRMSQTLVDSQKYGGDCSGEPLSDPKQLCASAAAAAYLEALLEKACDDDYMCVVAAFGKTAQDAVLWRSNLPKRDMGLWNSLPPGPEREQLVRFFAAGIVAENPSKFGLNRDKSISTLY